MSTPKHAPAPGLREAITELLAAGGAWGIEWRLMTIANFNGERDRLKAAYARVCALAGFEEGTQWLARFQRDAE